MFDVISIMQEPCNKQVTAPVPDTNSLQILQINGDLGSEQISDAISMVSDKVSDNPCTKAEVSEKQLQLESVIGHNDTIEQITELNDLTSFGSDLLLEACNARDGKDEIESSDPSSPSSPGLLSPSSTSESIFSDAYTQFSLVERSEGLNLADELSTVDSSTLWSMVSDDAASLPPERKSLKSSRDDAPSSVTTSPSCETAKAVFEPGLAISSSQFVFTKFGIDVPGVYTFGENSLTQDTSTSSVITGGRSSVEVQSTGPMMSTSKLDLPKQMQETVQTILDVSNCTSVANGNSRNAKQQEDQIITLSQAIAPVKRLKEPSLSLSFPSKVGQHELKIIVQPEEQHRARYMTEGSRGAVKDRSQQGHPVIQLLGVDRSTTLKVFVGTDTGRVKPHGFYQACKVCGKNSTSCEERDVDGTTVIEIALDPKDDMKASIDCVGILKLRNADVEQRIGLARSKKKSTRARLVFRVNIPKADGSYQTLQVASLPISCTQPAGMPELCKKSLKECSVNGGEELFIIGKNFTRGTKVWFRQYAEDGSVIWEAEAPVDQEYFHQGHMICTVPEYKDVKITEPVEIKIMAESSGRKSEAHTFTYTPVVKRTAEQPMSIDIKEEVAMDVTEEVKPKFVVSPDALQMNLIYMKKQKGEADNVVLESGGLVQRKNPAEQKQPTPQAQVINALIPSPVEAQQMTTLIPSPVEAQQMTSLIPSPVQAQQMTLTQLASELSPVGAQQPHEFPLQINTAPPQLTPVKSSQQVISAASEQILQPPAQTELHRVQLISPFGQVTETSNQTVATVTIANTSVSLPGFTVTPVTGNNPGNITQNQTTSGDLILGEGSNVEAIQGPSALLNLLTNPMDVTGSTTVATATMTTAAIGSTPSSAAGPSAPTSEADTFPHVSVTDVDRLLNTGNL